MRFGVLSMSEKTNQKRKPRASPKVSTYYKLDNDKVTRLKENCPRCGKGYFLAGHKDRLTCGNCGYTNFSSDVTPKQAKPAEEAKPAKEAKPAEEAKPTEEAKN